MGQKKDTKNCGVADPDVEQLQQGEVEEDLLAAQPHDDGEDPSGGSDGESGGAKGLNKGGRGKAELRDAAAALARGSLSGVDVEWVKLTDRERVADCLQRENYQDLEAVFRGMWQRKESKEMWQIVEEYLLKHEHTFPKSNARNNVYEDSKKETQKTKARHFYNLGLVSCRPYGKLSNAMSTGPGKELCLLLMAATSVCKEREDGKESGNGLFWSSGITLNLNGTTRVHCDKGNLGRSRATAFGSFVGGDTWVYDPAEIEKEKCQWLNVKDRRSLATVQAMAANARDYGTTPLKLRLKNSTDVITADAAWLKTDAGQQLYTKLEVQMPFRREKVYHCAPDFQGPLPHATAPAFPMKYKDAASRPEELRGIDITGWMSPDDADFVIKWCADHQEEMAKEGYKRYALRR